MKFLNKRLAWCILASIHLQAYAGAQDGPFVIWVNLSATKEIDHLIEEQLAKRENCSRPRLVVTVSPDWISDELVSTGFLKSDKKAIQTLDRLMRKPVTGEFDEGFDGIMVYDEVKGPRISVLTRSWKKVLSMKVASPGSKAEQWQAFCRTIPPITRPI